MGDSCRHLKTGLAIFTPDSEEVGMGGRVPITEMQVLGMAQGDLQQDRPKAHAVSADAMKPLVEQTFQML